MGFESLLDRMWQSDFEVFAHDWLLVCINYKTQEEKVFHNSSREEVYDWIQKGNPILCGHNYDYYDKFILKGVLSGLSPEELKNLNDFIIVEGRQGWEYDFGGEYVELPPIWDTMKDVVPAKSLKEIEANLGLDITETTIPFDLPTKWTNEQYEEVLYYCRADVNAIKPLFDVRRDYFETKYDLCMLANVDPAYGIGSTNAKLCAKFLEAKFEKRDDEREYTIPKTIDISKIDYRILEFFGKIKDDSIPSEELFKTKLEIEEHGMPSVISWGGKHGALPNFYFNQEDEPDMILVNADFASLYPHLLALPQYNFISRNIKDKNAYANTLKRRLQLKHEGKKKEQLALKLVLNTTYGCELNQYNDLYDAHGARGTCITGQLLISELSETIYEIGDVQLIQVNTDGVMVKIPKTKLDKYYEVCDAFSKKCGIELEYDIITKIVQKDVNNYVMLYGEPGHMKIKAKGGSFGGLPNIIINEDGSIDTKYKPDFKQNSLVICAEALAKELMFDIPIEKTINECTDVRKFQVVNHLGGTYEKIVLEDKDGNQTLLQRNNRIFSGLKPTGKVYKIKPDGRKDSLASCPVNPIVDNDNKVTIDMINKKWYINYAKQKVSDFKGERKVFMEEKLDKLKKDELIALVKEMKEKEEMDMEENVGMTPYRPTIYKKIDLFRKEIRKRNFVLDKVLPSQLGGGEYVSIEQYYKAVQECSINVGLDFSFEVIDVDRFDLGAFKPMTGAPQHVATVKCVFRFTDIDNGDEKSYIEISQGSDSVDKAVNGASTLAFRNWLDKNFTPNVFNGEEVKFGDDSNTVALDGVNVLTEKTEVKPKVFVSNTKKEEIKKELVSNPQKSEGRDEDIKKLSKLIYEYRELCGDDTKGSKTLDAIINGTITDAEVLSKTLSFENAIDKLKGE